MGSVENSYDYIVVGAGVSGVIVAARLRESIPSASVLLVEAGKDETKFDLARYAKYISSVRGSSIDYSYDTIPQKHLDGKPKKAWGGRALSGGGAINVGAWLRGPAVDYDRWAELTEDAGWSWEGLLPFLCKSETYRNTKANPGLHGSTGPMEVKLMADVRRGKRYPLFEPMKSAWQEVDPSLKWNEDVNDGEPLGMGDWANCAFIGGERQFPYQAFDLNGVEMITDGPVHRIVLDNRGAEIRATGIELLTGKKIFAQREVIVCAGAYNSPKLLLLSGIGSPSELEKLGIATHVVLPSVGTGLRDDLTMRQVWRLKNPERGLSLGSPNLTDPDLTGNVPIDFFVWAQAPPDKLRAALAKDGISDQANEILHPKDVHQEMYTFWMAGRSAAPLEKLGLKNDGSLICTSAYNIHPTSIGSVSLSSSDPLAPPLIDPNYYATETDKVIYRDALRKTMQCLLATPSGQSFVLGEVPPPGFPALSHKSSDAEIDHRVGAFGETGSHPSGGCAMGQTVDSRLRVRGVQRLRVVDASIFPSPISNHIQAAVYAVAEKGADLIIQDWKS